MTLTLNDRIQRFYDTSSLLWEQIWGEHLHHGYYGVTGRERKDRRQAQIELIEQFLTWSEVQRATQILDVGCGIGGSSLYLAKQFQASVTGITLSPVQVQRAQERAKLAGLAVHTQFLVADALNLPFADQSFDWVWSLESAEHFADKQKFLQEAYRVLKPGGVLMMATWCHRPIEPPGWPLNVDEQHHLGEIYRVYCLPYVIALPEYERLATQVGFQNLKTADWSPAVAPFWDVVIDSVFEPQALFGLLQAGWGTVEAALSLGLMSRGYDRGLIRFGLLRGCKPC